MCGRYYRRSDKQAIAEVFDLDTLPDWFALLRWNCNVAPTTHQPVIRHINQTGKRELVLMRWGMVPHFAKSITDFRGFPTINARAEALVNSAMWHIPFQRRRCLVPANGFYGSVKIDAKTKQSYAYSLKDGALFAFAGLWDAWKDPARGSWLQSFTIVTTTPNELTVSMHNRMPVMLRQCDYQRWLTGADGEDPPVELLCPYPAEGMTATEVHFNHPDGSY